jgi:type IV pilus assembly protein PilV
MRRGLIPGSAPQRLRGISMVEALVALVVLSVGMLGIAALFVESVRNSRTALLRTQAINLVSDMADRIRANASAGDAYDLAAYGGAPASHDCAPTEGLAGGNCTLEQLAEDDLARWVAAVNATLPSGGTPPTATVEHEAAAGGGPEQYVITVGWLEPGDELTAEGEPPNTYRSNVLIMPRTPPT